MNSYHRTASQQLPTGPNCALRIDHRNGHVRVRAAERDDVLVEIDAYIYAASSEEADRELQRIQTSISAEGNNVRINEPDIYHPGPFSFGPGPRIDYVVTTPKATSVNITGRNGKSEVKDVEGPVVVENHNGAVEVSGISQRVAIKSVNGLINVRDAGAEVELTTTNGEINIEHADGSVAAETLNGALFVSNAGENARLRTNNGPISFIGRVAGDLDFENINGPIRLMIPRDSSFEIDAESARGPVWSELDVKEAPSNRSEQPRKVRLRSVNGPIHIAPL